MRRPLAVFGVVIACVTATAATTDAFAATPPDAPRSVQATQTAAASATITWTPPSSPGTSPITGYGVSRDGVDSAGHGEYSTTVAASARRFTMTRLVAGRTYTLEVHAISTAGVGPSVSVPVAMLSAPTAFVLTQATSSTATVRWLPPTGDLAVTGYRVSRDGVDTQGQGDYATTVSAATRSFTMSRLAVRSAYTLAVRPITSLGDGPPASGRLTMLPGWTSRTPMTPADTAAASLSAVSCRSATVCLAVGSSTSSTGVRSALAEKLNGTAWSITAVPKPGAATSAGLADIACPTTTFCQAVGTYTKSGKDIPYSAVWNGSTWTLKTVPVSGTLTAVSCTSSSFCMAVGSTTTVVAARWNGSTWTASGVKSPALPSGQVDLTAVSCVSSTSCTAGGSYLYDDESLGREQFFETYNGSSWTLRQSVSPGGDLYLSYLESVSCTSSTFCLAVGYSYDRDDFYYGTDTYRGNGTTWTRVDTPDPSGTSEDADDPVLDSVSCVSTTCTSVGTTGLPYGPLTAFVINYIGSQSTLQALPAAGSTDYADVSCTSATACVAVGSSAASGRQRTAAATR